MVLIRARGRQAQYVLWASAVTTDGILTVPLPSPSYYSTCESPMDPPITGNSLRCFVRAVTSPTRTQSTVDAQTYWSSLHCQYLQSLPKPCEQGQSQISCLADLCRQNTAALLSIFFTSECIFDVTYLYSTQYAHIQFGDRFPLEDVTDVDQPSYLP